MKKTIGVLAFQGDVAEHLAMIEKIGHRPFEVRNRLQLDCVDALILPGGESTTIGFFLEETGLGSEIVKRAQKGLPIWGTCAGAILLARRVVSEKVPPLLGLMDMTVERNAYGVQIDSFTTELDIPDVDIFKLDSTFIRAPIIRSAGKNTKVLAKHEGKIVLARQGNLLASTFHPELNGDTRLLQWFVTLA